MTVVSIITRGTVPVPSLSILSSPRLIVLFLHLAILLLFHPHLPRPFPGFNLTSAQDLNTDTSKFHRLASRSLCPDILSPFSPAVCPAIFFRLAHPTLTALLTRVLLSP